MKDNVYGRTGQAVTSNVNFSLVPDLLDRYGPLMTLRQLAELLGRSPAGIRVGLYSESETSALLVPARIKIGRRLSFRTAVVGDALDALTSA